MSAERSNVKENEGPPSGGPSQLELFPREVTLEPTPAMVAGSAYAAQCSWCGLLVCVQTKYPLGRCPACKGATWWPQDLPIGPFRHI